MTSPSMPCGNYSSKKHIIGKKGSQDDGRAMAHMMGNYLLRFGEDSTVTCISTRDLRLHGRSTPSKIGRSSV